MYKLKILSIGKSKEAWLQEALSDYSKRLSPILSIEWVLLKTDDALENAVLKEPSFIALDPKGKSFSSEAFSSFLTSALEERGSRLTLLIGGATGISDALRKKATHLISLSPLTFTHQLTRLLLLEQIYRACEIQKGSEYHK